MNKKLKIGLVISVLVLFISGMIFKNVCDNQYESKLVSYLQAADSVTFKVTIRETMYNYNHLGKDIEYKHLCNGTIIESGEKITVYGNRIEFMSTITERDSIPDTGTVSASFYKSSACYGSSITSTTTVKEIGGDAIKMHRLISPLHIRLNRKLTI